MTILHGDCLELLSKLPANFVDAIVTDPPYGLGFMGKDWDRIGAKRDGHSVLPGGGEKAMAWNPQAFQSWCSSWASEALRVLRPGGHMLAFGGTRTFHRLVSGIEDAGFEIRDTLMWVYGQGFPKSHDISKAIDKKLGAERELKPRVRPDRQTISPGVKQGWKNSSDVAFDRPDAVTPEAQQWSGWGSALKPAYEPILLCRKPLIGTLAENVLAHGVGGINIDDCRVPSNGEQVPFFSTAGVSKFGSRSIPHGEQYVRQAGSSDAGRWPANVIHDGSDEVVEMFPQSATPCGSPKKMQGNGGIFGGGAPGTIYSDDGSAARFFYSAKASKKDRCDSKHPTVKPIALLKYLITLITPAGGTVLDPFAGSGTTGQAASELGFDYILIEREAEYVTDIERRLLMPEGFRA